VTKTIVIGYGNTLRRDDGAGVTAVERLAREFPETDVVTAAGLSPEMAERVAGCDTAIFVDASVRTKNVCVTRLAPSGSLNTAEGHSLSPESVLGLCSSLYGTTPREALLVEIPAFDCGFGETMSAATLRLVDCSVQLIRELLTGETTPEILLHLAPSPADD